MSGRVPTGIVLLVSAALLIAAPAIASAKSCAAEQGARRAADYLRQCRDLTAARERRACDDGRSCAALIEQIARGCEALGADGPDFCGLYAPDGDADADPDADE